MCELRDGTSVAWDARTGARVVPPVGATVCTGSPVIAGVRHTPLVFG